MQNNFRGGRRGLHWRHLLVLLQAISHVLFGAGTLAFALLIWDALDLGAPLFPDPRHRLAAVLIAGLLFVLADALVDRKKYVREGLHNDT